MLKLDRNTENMFSISWKKYLDEKKENKLFTPVISLSLILIFPAG